MKLISILGCTGSIGRNVLNIVDMFPDTFAVKALAAGNNIGLLAKQIRRFKPELAVVLNEGPARELKNMLPSHANVKIMHGAEGYQAAATYPSVNMVVSSMVGSAGLEPTLCAINGGKDIALANKETLVMAGDIVMARAREKGVRILPVDSEHSAIFQCISGQRREDLDKILLTASGGPFLNRSADEFEKITPEDALNHPTWDMGQKISIDSATLMNKGLEVIEAKHLFEISHQQIEVVIHPQSIVHSMVAYKDGAVIAQLGIPDMKGAISYAMSYPERLPLNQPLPDFAGIESLTFQKPDVKKFPCLSLAFKACETGGSLPAVLNAANEIAVDGFLKKQLTFSKIPDMIARIMDMHTVVQNPSLPDIKESDQWARDQAKKILSENRN